MGCGVAGVGGGLPVSSIRLRLPMREGDLYGALAGVMVRVAASLLRLGMHTLTREGVSVEM